VQALTKAAARAEHHLGEQVTLNHYAFYSKHLITTLARYLPDYYEKKQIEELFIDPICRKEEREVLHGDYFESTMIRKRVLVSSDFSTAYKIDHIIDAFE
jgi:hypothetical protein